MSRFSPFDTTLWFATAAPAPPTAPPDGRVAADVCVVGAGYTGLTTTLDLVKKGVKVVLLGAQETGFGCGNPLGGGGEALVQGADAVGEVGDI